MAADKPDVLVIGEPKPRVVDGLAPAFTVHKLAEAADRDAMIAALAPRLRAIAVTYTSHRVPADLMMRLPRLEIVASFGVGYDHVDVKYAREHGILVTNTPEVLNEEVADVAIGLLISTLREFARAERFLRAGRWTGGDFPLSRATLRNRTVGMVGMGRIGKVIAKRLTAMNVPVVYHSRRPAEGVDYRHYPSLVEMARDADVLLLIVPGGAGTRHLINAEVLAALGPDGVLINMARGSVVDEQALVDALRNGTILSAGLDVYAAEPNVPAELIAMDHVVLLPHIGSASAYTRGEMDQRVVDNLLAWAAGKPPPTPVPETPWSARSM